MKDTFYIFSIFMQLQVKMPQKRGQSTTPNVNGTFSAVKNEQ